MEYRVSSIGRGSAKVQIGAKLLCKGAKVGDRDTFPGLRSRLIGYQVRVRVRDMKCKGANAAEPRAKVQKLATTTHGDG
jgi:hypothetical protein